jgi:hypothetical protein
MKKVLFLIAILSLIVTANVYACVGNNCTFDNEVKSSGEGNKGNIFVYDCTKNGNIDVGVWKDPKEIPELKGDKGDKGDTGLQGIQGVKGNKGDTGNNGERGETGATGETGQNGQQGEAGLDGVKGDTGDSGKDGEEGKQGLQGIAGLDGKDVDPSTVNNINNKIDNLDNRINALESTQNIVGGELRIIDTKKWTVTLFADYNTGRELVDRTGIRFTFKIGKSYYDNQLEKLEKRLNDLEK